MFASWVKNALCFAHQALFLHFYVHFKYFTEKPLGFELQIDFWNSVIYWNSPFVPNFIPCLHLADHDILKKVELLRGFSMLYI